MAVPLALQPATDQPANTSVRTTPNKVAKFGAGLESSRSQLVLFLW